MPARTRSIKKLTPVDDLICTTYRGGPPPYVAFAPMKYSYGNTVGETAEITDFSNPGWRKAMLRGNVVMNPMTLVKIESEPCHINFKSGPYPGWYNGGYQTTIGDVARMLEVSAYPDRWNSEITIASFNSLALTRAYAKINEPGVLGGEIGSTMAQTIQMLKRPFSGVRELLKQMTVYRSKRLGKTDVSIRKATADTWLEYRYGWKPLILDGKEIIKRVGELRPKLFGQHLCSRSTEKREKRFSRPFNANLSFATVSGSLVTERMIKVSAGVLYTLQEQSSAAQIVSSLGLRVTDILPTIWELTPFSFVVDWFTNVGEYLQAVSPNPWVVFRGNWVTTVDSTLSHTSGGLISDTYQGLVFTQPLPDHGQERVVVSRVINEQLASYPLPTRKAVSLTHQADAMALSLQGIVKDLGKFRH